MGTTESRVVKFGNWLYDRAAQGIVCLGPSVNDKREVFYFRSCLETEMSDTQTPGPVRDARDGKTKGRF